jgi:hypothetical protein
MGIRYGGRKKGTPNKSTALVKEALELAFDGIGGVPALIAWAKREPTEFYKLFSKLLPQQHNVTGPGGRPIQIETKFDFSSIPTPELNEYESVLAKLKQRMGSPVGGDSN